MSSFHVIGLTSAMFIPTFAIFFHHVRTTNGIGAGVGSGVVEGVSISPSYRRIILYQEWVPSAVGLMALPLAVGVAVFQIAQKATEADARMVGYLYAFLLFVASLGAFLTAAAVFFVYAGSIAADEQKLTDDRR